MLAECELFSDFVKLLLSIITIAKKSELLFLKFLTTLRVHGVRWTEKLNIYTSPDIQQDVHECGGCPRKLPQLRSVCLITSLTFLKSREG
jgi:hypothetical protein